MRRRSVVISGFVASMLLAAPAAAVDGGGVYLLSMDINDGGHLVGSPRLKIAAGKPARIEIGSATGDHYSMSVTATPQAADTVMVASAIDVVSAGVSRKAAPSLLVTLGRRAAIEFGEDSPTSKPIHIDFTIDRTS